MSHLHPFRVGQMKCYVLTDGTAYNTASKLFATAPQDSLQEAIEDYDLQAESISVCFNMVFVDTGSEKLLIDTGVGHDATSLTHGFLYENLAAIGVEFADIDIVLISHAHADHIACNSDEDGNPLFPNARYLIWKDEWDYWAHPDMLKQCTIHTSAVRRNLLGIQDRFEMLTYEGYITSGVSIVTAFGHTPGHLAVHIKSDHEHFLYTADAFHHPLHIEHPGWVYHSDVNYRESKQSRLKLLNLAANTNALFASYHMQFPSLGRIERHGEGFLWVAAELHLQ